MQSARLAVFLIICLFLGSCSMFKKADIEQERKHPGNYLQAKTKILPTIADSVKLKITVKNKAKKTAYQNFDLLVQIKKKDGSASCSFGRKFQSAPLKPKRKQTIYYTLHCPDAGADRVEFLNIYGDVVVK